MLPPNNFKIKENQKAKSQPVCSVVCLGSSKVIKDKTRLTQEDLAVPICFRIKFILEAFNGRLPN